MRSKKYLILILSVASIFLSCTKSVSLHEHRAYLLDESNGLTKYMDVGNDKFSVTYWPEELVKHKELKDGDVFFFELKGFNPEVFYRKSEENFKLRVDNVDYRPIIVFAENLGWAEKNRLLVGFNKVAYEDMQLIYTREDGEALGSIDFYQRDLTRIPPLKTNK